jgi:nitronate monooxygenase
MSSPPPFEAFAAKMGLRVPIFQAPTGSIAGPELATQVSEAGAMGAMALTWAEPATAAEYVKAVATSTVRPFLVNFALTLAPRALTAALEAGAPVITFSWGDPSDYISLVRSFGAQVGIQVTNREGARRMLQVQPDFLVCQGTEAGGHVQATRSLDNVLPEVIEEAGVVPIVAAGGVGDGAAIALTLQMGASAVMLGTRFVATKESRAHPEYKRLLVQSQSSETALTVCFDGGWPYAAHRVLRNSTLESWEAAGCPPVGRRPGEGDSVGITGTGEPIYRYEDTAPRSGFAGDIEAMCCYAGTSCGAIHDVPSAGELVERLWRECLAELSRP